MKPLPPTAAFVRNVTVSLALAVCGTALPALAQRSGPTAVRPAYDQWTTYLNPRFAYQVPVPPGLRAQSDPRKGSSCRFVSDDGVLVLKVWGSTLVPGAGDPLDAAWREAVNIRGRRIDFQRRAPQAFVLAGVTADGLEFFEKVVLGNGATAGFNVTYPSSMARQLSGTVDEIEQGFGWHPEAPALSPQGQPQRGIFSGIRDYFTDDEPSTPAPRSTPAPSSIPRDPSQTTVDLTPPPPKKPDQAKEKVPSIPLEKTTPAPPPTDTPKPSSQTKREDLPFGIVIPGKKGYVYSPYADNKQQVDVTDIPTGTKVKCPYTGKTFRVP